MSFPTLQINMTLIGKPVVVICSYPCEHGSDEMTTTDLGINGKLICKYGKDNEFETTENLS